MDATLYKADGTQQTVKPQNGVSFWIEELYALLGCDTIEVIDTGDPSMILIGDEEARCKDEYTINAEATRIYRSGHGITDPQKTWDRFMEEVGGNENVIVISIPGDEPYTMAGDMIYCPSVMFD